MPVGASISAAGALGGAYIGSKAAKSAANTQSAAATKAADSTMQMFNTIRGDLGGYRDVGAAATPAYLNLLGLGPDGGAGIQPALEATPGYQFTRDQGIKSLANSVSARGLGGQSGAFGKGLARFVTGLADQTYNTRLSNLQGAVGIGQGAAAQTGTFGQAANTAANNALLGGANAQAAGTVGAANALSGGINSAAQGFLGSRLLSMYGPQMFGGQGGAAAPAYQTLATNPDAALEGLH